MMHRIFYMLEKECLEHRVVLRLPVFLVVLGLLILSYLTYVFGDTSNISFDMQYQGNLMPTLEMGNGLFGFISTGSGMLSLLLTFMYLPKTFLKARQEGSVMFWRSMPVSDLLDHTVKLIFALLLIPFICSLVLLSAELFLYLMSFIKSSHLLSFFGHITLANVFIDYFAFIQKMILLGFAILPMACLLLCLSQWINSPFLVFFVVYYVVKILISYVFDWPSLNYIIEQFSQLPLHILFSNEPLNEMLQVGLLPFCIAYLGGGLSLFLSLQKSKYGE